MLRTQNLEAAWKWLIITWRNAIRISDIMVLPFVICEIHFSLQRRPSLCVGCEIGCQRMRNVKRITFTLNKRFANRFVSIGRKILSMVKRLVFVTINLRQLQ